MEGAAPSAPRDQGGRRGRDGSPPTGPRRRRCVALQRSLQSVALAQTLFAALIALALPGCSGDSAPSGPSRFFERFESFGSFGTGAGHFNKPRSIAVDAAGIVHVADMTGRVQHFSGKGEYLGAWQAPETAKGRPKGMGVDADGHLMLVEPHYQRVTHFDPNGAPSRTWGRRGMRPGELEFPRAIAADSLGNLFVCEYLLVQRIQKFDHQGNGLHTWGQEGSGPGEFRRPEGLCVDRQDQVYVADSCNHRIQKFSPDGVFLAAFGTAGAMAGQLSYPYDVRVDAEGRIYVCEFGNSRIQILDENGASLELVGGAGAGEWNFRNPWSIAFDAHNNLWVADSMNHRIVKLTARPKKS